MAPTARRNTLIGMYLLEAAAVIGGMVLYKSGDSTLTEVVTTRLGYGLALAAALIVAGALCLTVDFRSDRDKRSFIFSIAVNLASAAFLLAVAEVTLRAALSVQPSIAAAFPRGFLPKDWNDMAARNIALLSDHERNIESGGAILRFDQDLGWTLGPSQTSTNGMYLTSVEGLRSASPDDSFGNTDASRRIALVGDSYTFGLGVTFEDTWANRLQETVGEDVQVLNFGVAGYGVDQAYLRYMKVVRSWKPDVVVLGIITHDLTRSQVVYPFIAFPSWAMPYAKPRYVMTDSGVRLVNVPLPPPAVTFATADIAELPVIDLEPTYFAPDWKRRWYHNLYSLRVMISVSPRWPAARPGNLQSLVDLNAEIVELFVASARRAGSAPVLVYFPSYGAGEVGAPGQPAGVGGSEQVNRMFRRAGVDYLDLSDCLADMPRSEGMASDGRHYSPKANRRVGRCLATYLQQLDLLH